MKTVYKSAKLSCHVTLACATASKKMCLQCSSTCLWIVADHEHPFMIKAKHFLEVASTIVLHFKVLQGPIKMHVYASHLVCSVVPPVLCPVTH